MMRLVSNEDYIAHHGIKGQKWGVRRFRNEDGSLTSLGQRRYAKDSKELQRLQKKSDKQADKVSKRSAKLARYSRRPRWLMDDGITANKAKRVDRAKRRYESTMKKAENLYKKMESRYSSEKMQSLDSSIVDFGRQLTQGGL